MLKKDIKAIVLAAGKGTRMGGDTPKVLCKINGKSMLSILLETLNKINSISEKIIVVGYKKEDVKKAAGSNYTYAVQSLQKGTAHAVSMTKDNLKEFNGDVIILCGDCPFISRNTIERLIKEHAISRTVCTVLTSWLDNPSGYGRIVKSNGSVVKIVEDLDCDEETREIKEVNSGVYIVNSKMLFEALENIENKNAKHEFYLTDIIDYFASKKLKVDSFMTEDIFEIQGINNVQQLKYVESVMSKKM